MSKKLELYYYPECPYCQRVLTAMRKNHWQGIELKNIHADPVADATLVRVGGKHQVPCLFVDGDPMYESLDIIAWLERELG
ncbi:MAG: glutathione S-transferase N-terminal domain-containing protein [Atopobiaceae bacterium]|nr:glutathione S-transferase N-terminal domain-containing protein [Atopobiaceae bacterium]MBR3314821.1 glutathione S-transferase N-terminal domain-containing protein [Atopobiaceae bacterium]